MAEIVNLSSDSPAFPLLTIALIFFSIPSLFAQGGALGIYEVGAPDNGSSYAGATARADDASTVYTNPAGMTRIDHNEFIFAGQGIYSDIRFAVDPERSRTLPPGNADGGGQAGGFVPAIGTYIVLGTNEKFKMGFAVNGLFGGAADYGDLWVGRTLVTEVELVAFNIQPAVAYKVNEWLSLGLGFNIVYTQFDLAFRAGPAFDAAWARIRKAQDWNFALSPGILIEPNEKTRIGFKYRSPVTPKLNGSFEVPAGQRLNFDVQMGMADGFNVALYHEVSDKWALLADSGWSNWSRFSYMPVAIVYSIGRNEGRNSDRP